MFVEAIKRGTKTRFETHKTYLLLILSF